MYNISYSKLFPTEYLVHSLYVDTKDTLTLIIQGNCYGGEMYVWHAKLGQIIRRNSKSHFTLVRRMKGCVSYKLHDQN